MKHAGPSTLLMLEGLINKLRGLPGLVERRPGTFYVKSSAYLHFHEDPAGVFADVKLTGDAFSRFPVNTKAEQALLFSLVVKQRAASARAARPS